MRPPVIVRGSVPTDALPSRARPLADAIALAVLRPRTGNVLPIAQRFGVRVSDVLAVRSVSKDAARKGRL